MTNMDSGSPKSAARRTHLSIWIAIIGLGAPLITTFGTVLVTIVSTRGNTAISEQKVANANSVTDAVCPVGTIVAYAGDAIDPPLPAGWLLCVGQSVPRDEYLALSKAMAKQQWKTNADPKMLTIPDLRGQFLRGLDPLGRIDPEGKTRAIGKYQDDSVGPHSHPIKVYGTKYSSGQTTNALRGDSAGDASDYNGLKTEQNNEGGESRPRNIAVNWIIRAR